MTLVVPFDGSPLAESALVRAMEFSAILEEDVVAVSIIPRENTQYAREKGWISEGEKFDLGTVIDVLETHVEQLAPRATWEWVIVDQYAPAGTIASRLRREARDRDATMVVLGSDNAGRLVTSMSSVGSGVATDVAYDVVIVRHPRTSEITRISEADRSEKEDLEFYVSR